MRSSIALIAAGLVAIGSHGHAAIVIDSYTHAANDRFTNSPSFIAGAFNLSGVGQATDGRWATAISRNVIISAAHLPPVGTVHFYPGNDPAAAPVMRQIVSGTRVGSTDLYVAVLSDNLPSSIRHFSFADVPLAGPPSSLVGAGPYQGLNAYLFGLSPFDENSDPTDNRTAFNDQAVGRNAVSGYVENIEFQTNLDSDAILLIKDLPTSPNYVLHEALFQTFDSGGPTFVEIGGELVLLGTNAFIANDSSYSGINYTGNQAGFINQYIAANAVPEPSAALLIGYCAFGLALHRRRRVAF